MKQFLTTEEAFNQLIHEKAVWNKLQIPEGTVMALRNRFKNKKISLDKMEEILIKAGWKVKQEKLWKEK